MISDYTNDLIVLVADKNTQFTLKGLFKRYPSLGIRDISMAAEQIFVHPLRDPGCYSQCVDFLRPYIRDYNFALVLFDHDGSGQESKSREELESELEQKLSISGWENRAAVVVLEPELEIWVWNDSPHIERILDWEGRTPNLKDWLISEGFLQPEQIKPTCPKEALEEALRISRKPRSSSIYEQIASQISFSRCQDSSFLKLKEVLQNWFAQ